MKNRRIWFVLFMFAFLLSSMSLAGSTASAHSMEGTGDLDDPYIIRTPEDLYSLESDYCYELGNDIDFEGRTITPIPTRGLETFNGRRYSIKNFTIEGPNAALFTSLNYAMGGMYNVTIENATVTSTGGAAAILVSSASDTYISNCVVKNSVLNSSGQDTRTGAIVGSGSNLGIYSCKVQNSIIRGESFTGGLAGAIYNEEERSDSVSNCNVEASEISGTYAVGGLVGVSYLMYFDKSSITDSLVTATDHSTGGIVGLVDCSTPTVYLRKCFSTSNVVSTGEKVGGLVGDAKGMSIDRSYAQSDVTGANYVGGLVGTSSMRTSDSGYIWPEDQTYLKNSYHIGSVTATSGVAGGLAGKDNFKTIENTYCASTISADTVYPLVNRWFTNSYFNQETAGITTPSEAARTTAQMFTQSNYNNWNFDSIWTIDEGNGYPTLR